MKLNKYAFWICHKCASKIFCVSTSSELGWNAEYTCTRHRRRRAIAHIKSWNWVNICFLPFNSNRAFYTDLWIVWMCNFSTIRISSSPSPTILSSSFCVCALFWLLFPHKPREDTFECIFRILSISSCLILSTHKRTSNARFYRRFYEVKIFFFCAIRVRNALRECTCWVSSHKVHISRRRMRRKKRK